MSDEKENPKTILALCKNCSGHVEVEVPEYMKRVEKLPCTCGLTDDARCVKNVSTCVAVAITAISLSMFGSCWVGNHYDAECVKAVKGEGYEIYKAYMKPGTDYKVRRIQEYPPRVDPSPEKPEEKKP